MKRKIFGFVLVVLWLCFPKYASAQQCLAPHYSSYTSTVMGSNQNTVIQTVSVSGYTEALNPAIYVYEGPLLGWQWVYPCANTAAQMQNATHTSAIRNVVGSTGGNYSQGPTPAFNYNNYSISVTASLTPGTVYSGETDFSVTCAVVGVIYNGGGGLKIEIAYTRAISLGAQSNCSWNSAITQEVCDISAKPWCTAATTPPDWYLDSVRSQVFPGPPPSWWEAFNVCLSYGVVGSLRPWVCSPTGIAFEMYAPPTPLLANCSYNL
jgi:hypothetical protein